MTTHSEKSVRHVPTHPKPVRDRHHSVEIIDDQHAWVLVRFHPEMMHIDIEKLLTALGADRGSGSPGRVLHHGRLLEFCFGDARSDAAEFAAEVWLTLNRNMMSGSLEAELEHLRAVRRVPPETSSLSAVMLKEEAGMCRERLEEIMARWDGAFASPWVTRTSHESDYNSWRSRAGRVSVRSLVADRSRVVAEDVVDERHAEMIANAPDDIGWLVAELLRLLPKEQ